MIDRTKYLSKAEVKQLRSTTHNQAKVDKQEGNTTGPLNWLIVDMALSTGLRVSELAAIQVKHVDFRRGLIKVSRLKRTQPLVESLAIADRLKKHIRRYIKWAGITKGPLFVGQRGPMTPAGLAQAWKSAVRRAGLPKAISIHCARHTCAVHLLPKTNLRQVQKQLGHSSPATTANFYADVSFEDMKAGVTNLYD